MSLNDDVLAEDYPQDQLIDYAEISDVHRSRRINWQSPAPFANAPSRARRRVLKGDVIVSTVRTYLRAVAQIETLPANPVVSTGFAVLRPRCIDSRFLGYIATSQEFVESVVSRSVGVSYPAINASEILNIHVPVPPLADQRRIADYLDRETAEIDKFTSDLSALRKLSLERRRSFAAHLLQEPHLTRASSHSTWQKTTLGKVVEIGRGQVDPSMEAYRNLPLIAPNHIEARTGRLISLETAEEQGAESGKYLSEKGAILFSKIRPALLKSVIAPARTLCSADMYVLQPNREFLTPGYLLQYLLSLEFEFYASSSSERVAMPKLNRESLAAAPISLPSLERQYAITEELSEQENQVYTLIADIDEALQLAKEHRSALISAAVTGKLDVTSKEAVA